MAVACPSRFAVLKVEGEEPEEQQKPVKTNAPKTIVKATVKGAEGKAKPKKKKKPADKDATAKAKPKAEAPKEGSEDWESWKRRDDQFVTDTYEQDLQEALLRSRLEYEEKRRMHASQPKEAPAAKQAACASGETKPKKKKKNKEKKTATLTLEEFNQREDIGTEDVTEVPEEDADAPAATRTHEARRLPVEEDIFNQVLKEAGNIISMEQRAGESKKKQPFCLEQVRQIQYQEELEKKDEEIVRLTSEVERLTKELKVVKVRNKQLCIILGHGEMKDKAEILKSYEELSQVKDELTQEVAELHAALEQERSKVHSLQTELKKPGKKENR